MENAVKALLIAGGVLVGIILLSLITVSYRQISSYYQEKEQTEIVEELSDFNKDYIPYNRNGVRGSDLLSLINKVVDFNTLNYDKEPITISITIPNDRNEMAKVFYYKYDDYKDIKLLELGETYTETTISGIINEANNIETKYTKSIATKLAANMSTLMNGNSRKSPEELLAELKINATNYGGLSTIQYDILKYYQYNQFKRAHFNCVALNYTTQGRVKSFNFEFNGEFE